MNSGAKSTPGAELLYFSVRSDALGVDAIAYLGMGNTLAAALTNLSNNVAAGKTLTDGPPGTTAYYTIAAPAGSYIVILDSYPNVGSSFLGYQG